MANDNIIPWIEVWEDDDRKGDHKTLSGARGYDDLSEYYYGNKTSGFMGQLDDSINSLQTGPSTWVVAFSSSRYRGEALRIGPNETINKLNDYKRLMPGDDWKNQIASLIVYAAQPNFWDTDNHVLDGDCWLKLYWGKRFDKYAYRLGGKGQLPSPYCLTNYAEVEAVYSQYGASPMTVTHPPASLTTGPGTWVRFYSDHFSEDSALLASFGPNSIVSDLGKYVGSTINSVQVYDAIPDGWAGNSAEIPDDIISIQQAQTSEQICGVVSGLVGLIPEVGGALSLATDILWPDLAPSPNQVWNDMARAAEGMMQDLINANNINDINDRLKGINEKLRTYLRAAPGATKIDDLTRAIEDLNDLYHFLMPQDGSGKYLAPVQNLPYLVNVGTLTILAQGERAYNYEANSGGVAADDSAEWRNELDEKIKRFTADVQRGLDGIIDWRTQMISVSHQGDKYLLSDTYSGYEESFKTQDSANSAFSARRDYVYRAYSPWATGLTVQANLWPAYLSDNIEDSPGSTFPFPGKAFRASPQPLEVTVKLGSYPSGQNLQRHGIEFPTGFAFQHLTLYASEANYKGFIQGLKFTFLDEHGTSQTKLLGTQTNGVMDTPLGGDETILGFYGGSGSYLDQLFYRTNLGRDVGNGGGGGSAFRCSPPQGVGARTTRISAGSVNGYLGDYVHEWVYTAYTVGGRALIGTTTPA